MIRRHNPNHLWAPLRYTGSFRVAGQKEAFKQELCTIYLE
mgnify:FL=1